MLRGGRRSTPKSNENTVFVRFFPASPDIRRHHLEDLFSQIGPIKKSSVILQSETSAYGFVKYTTAEDAALASVKFNDQRLPGLANIRVKVETAQPVEQRKTQHRRHQAPVSGQDDDDKNTPRSTELDPKKTNRLILRNLSFYAKESDIRQALERFGDITEVHIPTVSQGKRTLSRGFGFVTFDSKTAALKCLNADSKPIVRDRPVDVAYAQHKSAWEEQKKTGTSGQSTGAVAKKTMSDKAVSDAKQVSLDDEPAESDVGDTGDDNEESVDDNEEDEKSVDESVDSSSAGRDEDEQSGDESRSDNEVDDEMDVREDETTSRNDVQPSVHQTIEHDRDAVSEQRCLFIRNLPFDATRHDLFELFKPFGFVTAIYLVRDKDSGAPRGTAFVSFKNVDDARKVSERGVTSPAEGNLMLNGRELAVDLAVDKETAGTLNASSDRSASHKDRRNMYLLTEGRVDNDEAAGKMAWDELPENDKSKRQSAWSDKNTKLKSPIFFINPCRLSIRNLSKQIDEVALKKLFVHATERGLRLVKTEDQIAHWKTRGTMTTRDILERMKDPDSIIPPFDRTNIRQHIPSVFIQRDFTNEKAPASSRGFGFVEFQHHAHALACLRELNNNTRYSREFAAGGKAVSDANQKRTNRDPLLVPRLIVEFTVENKVKAKQQAERRAEQQANKVKQKGQQEKPQLNVKNKKRGAAQRERKRSQQDTDKVKVESAGDKKAPAKLSTQARPGPKEEFGKKMKRPRKRIKVDEEDDTFSKLVESYKKQAVAAVIGQTNAAMQNDGRETKRWFDS